MKEPGHFDETLPEGVQLTLNELRDMAYRQQHQIESQHQLLAAKEQRLLYLKEQEARHQRVATENERLRRLRDRVEAQELKLRKLRALRGQVDQNKQNNALLTSDLDSIRALFNEKEKELSVAVAKVDELTRQIEDLRQGQANEPPSAPALELEKLRRELMYRNKLNEQQNARLYQQREALTQRQEEMSNIDKRISELQDRLHRKRILNQQLANQITAASNKPSQLPNQLTDHSIVNLHQINHNNNITTHGNSILLKKQLKAGNIGAIEPYNHHITTQQTNDNHQTVDKLQKNYFIPVISNQLKNTNLNHNDNINNYNKYHSKESQHELLNNVKKNNTNQQYQQQQQQHQQQQPPQYNKSPIDQPHNDNYITEFNASKSDPKYQTLPYNTKFSVNFLQLTKENRESSTVTSGPDNEKESSLGNRPPQSSNNNNNNSTELDLKLFNNLKLALTGGGGLSQHHMTVHSTPLNIINKSLAVPLTRDNNNFMQKQLSNTISDHQKIGTDNESSINNHLHSQVSSSRGQPVGAPSTTVPIASSAPTINNQSSTNFQKPTSVTSTTSIGTNKLTPTSIYQTSSTKIQPVQPQTIIVPQMTTNPSSTSTTLSDSLANNTSDKSPKPILPPKPAIKPPPRQTQPMPTTISELNSKIQSELSAIELSNKDTTDPPIETTSFVPTIIKPNYDNKPIKAKPLTIKKQPLGAEQPRLRNSKLNGVHVSINRRIEMPPAFLFENESPPKDLVSLEEKKSQDVVDKLQRTEEIDLEDEIKKNKEVEKINDTSNVIRRNKTNLKQSGKANLSRRVSFDPLALLLDASLEGELELVKKTATQVPNPSAANDEGITALHNAICAGHLEIVEFLVEFGCDVNAQDSDGWTPLHCAASCNNVAMVRFLVEHGACIFATTLSDHETAAEKCEEDEEGFDGCSEYLYSVQEKLGILCSGAVYAVFDYTSQQSDELTFSAGNQLTVLRKGDENEREWWWARFGDREGYIPRNLLGLYPRVTTKSPDA